MGEPLNEDHPVGAGEVGPLDAIAVGLGPIQPVVIGCDAVGPVDALRDDAGHVGSIHEAPVNSSCSVTPVCPEHETVGQPEAGLTTMNLKITIFQMSTFTVNTKNSSKTLESTL